MATLLLRMRDDLKAKAQQLASEQGVSLKSYSNATLAATIAQSETLAMMGQQLTDIDQEKLHDRVTRFMSKSRPGKEPTPDEIRQANSGQ